MANYGVWNAVRAMPCDRSPRSAAVGLRSLLSALVLTSLLNACGRSGGDSSAGASQPTPGSAQSWSVTLANDTGTCFKPEAALGLVVTATDSSGQAIANPEYTASAVPSDGVGQDSQGRMIVRGEGPLELTVSYTGQQAGTSTIAPKTFQLMRDGTAPVITITSPLRGAMRQTTANDDAVDIAGNVTDALSAVKAIVVGDEALAVNGGNTSESIAVTRPAHWGTNIVRVRAADACGNTAEQVQSFLQSNAYLAPVVTQNIAARVPNASVVRVAQAALDDNNRADLDDVVSLAERFLQHNLAQFVNSFIAAVPTISRTVDVRLLSCDFSADPIAAMTIAPGSPTLALALEDGKFTFASTLHDVRIPVTYRAVCRGFRGRTLFDLSGTFGHTIATLAGVVTATPHIVDRQLDTPLTIDTTVTGFSVDSTTNPRLASVINAFAPFIFPLVEGALEPAINSALRSFANDAVPSFLAQLTRVVPIHFPDPINKTLNVAVDWTGIGVDPAAVTMELGQYVFPSAVGTPYASGLGAISGGVATRSLDGLPGPLTYGLNDDGVNQMLWALWYGGGLELHNLQAYAAALPGVGVDLTGVTLDISGLLPPVMMPAGDPAREILSLGDVHVTGSVDLDRNATLAGSGVVSFDLYASLLTDGRSGFDVAGNALDLRFGDLDRDLYLQVNALDLNGSPMTGADPSQALKEYLRGVIRPLLQQLAHDASARIQLPQFRIDLPEQFFGANAGFILDIVSLKRDQDRFVLSVDPDDAYAPTVSINNWDQLAQVAINAARQEAGAWLQGARLTCSIDRTLASGVAVFRDTYDITDGVKQALLQAGATEAVARDWNRIFKSAWLAWGDRLEIPNLPWFPDFAGDGVVGVPHFSVATTGPLGTLTSSGRSAMTRTSLQQALEFALQDYVNQPRAMAAIDAFASDISGRFDTQLQIGTLDGVDGGVIYLPDQLWPLPPLSGPMSGICGFGGRLGGNAFQ